MGQLITHWIDDSNFQDGVLESAVIEFKQVKSIFIPGNVCSSKNSKKIAFNPKTKQRFVIDSPQVERYRKVTAYLWKSHKKDFDKMISGKSKPYKIEFQFVRDSKRNFDFVNLLQLPLDMMVEYEWIEDDNYLNVVPVINPEVIFDKFKAGIIIKVL